MYVHPVVLQLESALASDSLRTLCRVLAGASGKIKPSLDNPDRTKKPIMDASLTVRAFLRFVELRHGASDDLAPSDFAGKCGSGVRVLLRKCREYNDEVFAALQTRVDDVVKMIRAFYDQTALLGKFQPFFRAVIEAAIPAILARKREPLPRLISFLEAYGDIQLTFLYEAAQLGTFTSRRDDLETAQLLDTTQGWIQKARRGELAVILVNKVRSLVLSVALLDIELSPQQRTEWVAAAYWAAMPEMSQMMERMEVRIREGMVERADPGELFGLAALLSAEGIKATEFFQLLGRMLRQAFAEAGPARGSEVLSEVESRPSQPYPEEVVEALGDISSRFATEATAEQLEHLLGLWVERSFALQECPRSVARVLLESEAEKLPPGPTARSGKHLSGLGVDDEALAPLVEKLLGMPPGWALEQRAQPESDEPRLGEMLGLLGGHLWPRPEAPAPRLPEAEAVLRLVGPAMSPPRDADTAARHLVGTLASQLPGRSAQVETAVTTWCEGDSQRGRLAAVVAPLLLEEAKASSVEEVDEGTGHLARSVALLSRALRREPLGLRSAEWALSPFAGAGSEDVDTALGVVAAACGASGASEAVVDDAARRWLKEESPPAGLGRHVVEAALSAWETEGTRGDGLDTLRKVYSWLSAEVEGLRAQSSMEPGELGKVLLQVATLLNTIDGQPPKIAELKRAREGVLGKLGLAGRMALADAVAMAWSSALPGLTPGLAAAHFELYWNGRSDSRSVVENLVSGALDELRWQSRLRLQATFGQNLPPGMQGPPAWRVEGKRKVPWFVHEDVTVEAFGAEGDENLAERGRSPSEKGAFVRNANMKEKAKTRTGGVCTYCGSGAGELGARLVFPLELGGQNLESNLAPVCPLCMDFLHRLGPRRWGEVLLEKPEKAAEVWWEAQKKANMKTLDFLTTKQNVPTDLRPSS